MLRSDRPAGAARDLGRASASRVTSVIRGRRKPLMYVGTALALAGAGTASAATVGASAAAAGDKPARHSALRHADGRGHLAARRTGVKSTAARNGATTSSAATGSAAARAGRFRGGAHALPRMLTWRQVRNELNRQTNPRAARHGRLPLADRLLPVGITGPQAFMPIGPAQEANATTIVAQTLSKRLGIRSAVIAVATAMQESMLHNIDYGDADSLGLFQQRPDIGWGSAAQILDPVHASDAFLTALRDYQHRNPSWARQPLWYAAQSVQRSAFPGAYAKWEAQAAHLVQRIAMRLA